jgi:hypothetical protein
LLLDYGCGLSNKLSRHWELMLWLGVQNILCVAEADSLGGSVGGQLTSSGGFVVVESDDLQKGDSEMTSKNTTIISTRDMR